MKKVILFPLAFVLFLSSCTTDTDEIENAEITESNLRISKIENDPNFKELVYNFALVVEKTYSNTKSARPSSTLEPAKLLEFSGFTNGEEFMNFQFEQQSYYSRLIRDYSIKTESQRADLTDKLTTAVSSSVSSSEAGSARSCVGQLFGCLMGAVMSYQNYLLENTGVGCVWNPGTPCMIALQAFQEETIDTMSACVLSYWAC